MLLVSACLAGFNCKYSGGNNCVEDIKKLVEEGKAIIVCPEQMGGCPTPRHPCEIVDGANKVVKNSVGEDVSLQFYLGARETLQLAKMFNISIAILKSRSPSCGCGKIYDGTFSGKLIAGNGVTSQLLIDNGIKVYNETNFHEIWS